MYSDNQGFEVEHVVPTPSFTFVRAPCALTMQGGQKGAVVTTIAFRHVQ